MAIAKKKSDLRQIERQDFNKKIKLEESFYKDIIRFLKTINNDFFYKYIGTGVVIRTQDYKNELIGILNLNYNKISNKFKYNIRESFPNEIISPQIDALINNNITDYQKYISNIKSDYILKTTDKEITTALSISLFNLIKENKPTSKENVATYTKKKLDDNSYERAQTITTTETQNISESSKDIEEKTLIKEGVILGGLILKDNLLDYWVSTLDEKTRAAHANAYGQSKKHNEMFLVGGEYLKYPGDPNGRTENIINCRCSKVSGMF